VTTVVFIGDEVTAAAVRLTGVTAQVPKPADVQRVFEQACDAADLVMITAEHARALDEKALHSAVRRADPLVLVVPDGGNRYWPEDLDARVDIALGIEQ
jgi:vacuolar-type H+-ATPase subunit F/Vma7